MADKNKLDGFDQFDPTQPISDGVYFDQISQSWKLEPQVVRSCSGNTAEFQKKLADANRRIAELEKQIANQPTECDILAKYLTPVFNLASEQLFFTIKPDLDCPDLMDKLSSLGDEPLGNVGGA